MPEENALKDRKILKRLVFNSCRSLGVVPDLLPTADGDKRL